MADDADPHRSGGTPLKDTMADVTPDDDLVPSDAEDIDDVDDVDDDEFDLDDDGEIEVDAEVVDDVDEPNEEAEAPAKKARGKTAARGDDEEEDEEDDFDADDVEEDLGEILKARLATATDDEEEDEDEPAALDSEDRTNNANRVQPKRPEEFVCQSCFLVKHPSQLADAKHQLCSDCV